MRPLLDICAKEKKTLLRVCFIYYVLLLSQTMSPFVSAFQISQPCGLHETMKTNLHFRRSNTSVMDPLKVQPFSSFQRNLVLLHETSRRSSSKEQLNNISNGKQQEKQKQEQEFSTIAASVRVSSSDIMATATQQNGQEEQEQMSITIDTKESSNSSSVQNDNNKKLTPKAFNAFLLLAAFGFAFYSILSVDDGMTRGWSIAEKAMRIPIDNWSSYESSLNAQPIFTKTMINVVIYLLGDWLSQTLFIKKNLLEFDAWRTMRNGLIGMVFGPLVHEYYEFSDYILPVDVDVNRFYKIAMDQTIYIFVKCSAYIVAVNMLAGESWQYSRDEAKGKIKGIMFTAWKFWPLVHCVTYGAIPARHRILWVNCVDLFWNAILASMASGSNDDNEEDNDNNIITEDPTISGGNVSDDDVITLNPLLIDESDMDELTEVLISNEAKQRMDDTINLDEPDDKQQKNSLIENLNEKVFNTTVTKA
mmetsp:Transcript_2289/g.3258  ORF Transcript_2289/g.3258 Transcript_2289/m.3258 type:complete len:476 (+) Transcript_2289:96-1523(+)